MDHAFSVLLPASLLTLGVLGVLLADLIGKGRRVGLTVTLALASLAGAAIAALTMDTTGKVALGVLAADEFSVVFTVFCCVVGFLTIVATMRGEAFRKPGGEFLSLVLAGVLGMSMLSMATDMIMLYLAFETVSIPSYVLVGMRRADPRANEASLKYVLFGAVSSGLMIYGLSFFVGLSGGTSLDALSAAIANGAASQPIFLVASLLVFAGFAFKISAVPFHFWSPDVYAGAPASVGGFLAVASKAAGFAGLVRLGTAVIPEAVTASDSWLPNGGPFTVIMAIVAILTMTIGNWGALRQREIKRLLAWSSIAHAGYILLALSIWSESAVEALLIYLVAYLFMNMAAFFFAGVVIRDTGSGQLSAFRGLARSNTLIAVSFAIILFSLTGLPPFFGFVAKLSVFYAIFEKGYWVLGVIGLLNGVISLYYYAVVVRYMFLDDIPDGEEAPRLRLALVDRVFCLAMVVPVLVFGLFWEPVKDWAARSVSGLLGS